MTSPTVCECWGCAWGGLGGDTSTSSASRWPQSGVQRGCEPHNPPIWAPAALLAGVGGTELWHRCPRAACSLGQVLMSLITGLVCAINVYFVVDFLPTLRGLGYLIPLGLLLVAYVAFVTYLVRAEGGWGSVCGLGGAVGPSTATVPAMSALFAFSSGRAALLTGRASWPGDATTGSASMSPPTCRGWQGRTDGFRPSHGAPCRRTEPRGGGEEGVGGRGGRCLPG